MPFEKYTDSIARNVNLVTSLKKRLFTGIKFSLPWSDSSHKHIALKEPWNLNLSLQKSYVYSYNKNLNEIKKVLTTTPRKEYKERGMELFALANRSESKATLFTYRWKTCLLYDKEVTRSSSVDFPFILVIDFVLWQTFEGEKKTHLR